MINQRRYIRIVSGVGAGVAVAERQLIMRAMTQNSVLPPGIVAEFGTSDAVGAYFGTNSEEYRRALAYFTFVSKSIQSPTLISFARWVNAAIAPMIVGDSLPKDISTFAQFNAGKLSLMVGNSPVSIDAINTSGSTDLTQVAAAVQAKIRTSTEAQLTNATVTYNSNTNQFVLTGSVTGSGSIKCIATNDPQDMSVALGWSTGNAVAVSGQAADTPDQAVAKSSDISNNFGSFIFCTPSVALTNDEIVAIAAWNDAQNNMYMYSLAALPADATTLSPLLLPYSGCALNIMAGTANEFIEQSPCEILAATNYNTVNATQNYMFYQFPARPATVSTDAMADQMDALRANYIGVTQSAGQLFSFYQRGLLMGGSQAALDMNTYANEMWLKSAISAQVLALFLNSPEVPANEIGQAMLLAIIQSIITKARNNGVISAGKTLTELQKQYITRVSGDAMAWRQVQNIGYWIDLTFTDYVNNNTKLKEYKAVYQLIYSKDDVIRYVEGSDVLI
jgi:hypothetical protein